MVHTFATREEAAIFASAMRSDGYFAGILDEGMGPIYGPLAIGGIRVVVSDEPIEKTVDEAGDKQPLPVKAEDGEFLRTLRLMIVGIAGFGLVVGAIMLLWLLLQLLDLFSEEPVAGALAVFHVVKFPLGIALFFVLAGPLMTGFTRLLRGENLSAEAAWLRWLLLALLIPFLLLAAV